MVDVQERHLIVLLSQDEENRVQKVDKFEQIKEVGNVENLRAHVGEIISWLGNAEKLIISLTLRVIASLFSE